MPTRKQRRRREKDFRHDVRVFEVDEEGNEVPIAALREKEQPKEKAAPAKAKAKAKSGRPAREPRGVRPPSWERALKVGGGMGALMFLVSTFGLKQPVLGLIYGVGFIPMTYWMDRVAHRAHNRRLAKQQKKP